MRKITVIIALFLAAIQIVSAQKVGLVLSGGGAKGAAHIGVIKALEENNIPIDYITGTSIGAIIGSLYAMGYSPEEMLELMLSKEFAYWQTGTVEEQYTYYFKEPYPTPEFAHFSIDMSDSLQIKASFLPQSLINPIQMNQAFMALFSQATAKAGWNFDNLFVPFRCVASDIYTETRVEIDFVKGCSNLMSNKVIAKELWDNLVELGAPEYTEEEMKFAKAISEGVGDSRFESLEKIAKNCKDKAAKAEVLSHKGESMYRFVAPFNPDGIMSFGSTDVGDVSWNCPTAQAYVATWAAGTPGHSWQVVSQGKSGLAHKGLIYAAKAMAGAAIDMYEDPEIIAKAKAEMEEELDGDTYHCPIPDGCKPRAIGMKM